MRTYPQAIRDEAVIYYERGHTFADTRAKYGMAESTFFEWKKRFDQEHPLADALSGNSNAARKQRRHLEKLALELEVLQQCPCGAEASVDEKVDIHLAELAKEPFIMLERRGAPDSVDHQIELCRQNGFSPIIAGHVMDASDLKLLVGMGKGVAFYSNLDIGDTYGIKKLFASDDSDS